MKLQKKGCVTLPVCISSLGHCVNSEGLSKMGSDREKTWGAVSGGVAFWIGVGKDVYCNQELPMLNI